MSAIAFVAAGLALVATTAACNKSETAPAPATPMEASAPSLVAPATSSSASTDAMDAGAIDAAPSAIAPRQSIRFHLAATSSGSKRAFVRGFAIERADADGGTTRIVTEPPPSCPCSPCSDLDAGTKSDTNATLTWDGRAYAIDRADVACPDGGHGNAVHAIAQPVPAGRYRARFLVASCAAGPGDACKKTNARPDDVEFDLPASGDVDVEVK